uniref:DUF7344 domain-containing protein n=1 Tax=Halopiger goleimassiliensis TaxID=1293048 RepID=UPI0012B62DF3|nr:hypothetical protein [Halopiger goleimassiliensis]
MLCTHLADRGASIGVGDATAHLLEETTNDGDRSRRSLEIELHHTHLPLLADANVIRYDRSRDRIEPGENLQAAWTLIETATRETLFVS